MDVDRARSARIGHPPDAVEQLVARDDDAGVLEQVGEQVELLAGQFDGLACDPDLAGLRVERDIADLEQLVIHERDGALVRLRDIATVELGAEDYEFDVRFSGEQAVFMGVWVLPDAAFL